MLVVKTRSPHPIVRLVFSPDGATLAVAQPHTGVSLLDRATGHETATATLPRVADYNAVAFCDGGRRLAVGAPNGVYLLEIARAECVNAHTRRWHAVALTECKGQLLVATSGGSIGKLDDPDDPIKLSYPCLRTVYLEWFGWPQPEQPALVVAFSPCAVGLRVA